MRISTASAKADVHVLGAFFGYLRGTKYLLAPFVAPWSHFGISHMQVCVSTSPKPYMKVWARENLCSESIGMIGTLSWCVGIDDETDMCVRYVFVCLEHEKKPLHRFGMELLPYKHIFRIRDALAFWNWCLRFPLFVCCCFFAAPRIFLLFRKLLVWARTRRFENCAPISNNTILSW